MKTKILFLMFLVVLFTVFVSQNTNIIPINIFFWKVDLSTIVVISISFLIGMILGFIIISLFSNPKKKEIVTPPQEYKER